MQVGDERELRAFFSSGVSAGGEAASGAGRIPVASGAVQELMRALIAAENPARPLSDARLAAALQEKVNIARRTVAKYREQMKILPGSCVRGYDIFKAFSDASNMLIAGCFCQD